MLAFDNIWTREPRLASPNVAPLGRVAFDRRHPIAPYIKSLVLASQKHDLISGAPITTTVVAAPWEYVVTPYGIAKHSGAVAANNVYDTWSLSLVPPIDDVALLWVAGGNQSATAARWFLSDTTGGLSVGAGVSTSEALYVRVGGTSIAAALNTTGIRTRMSHGYLRVVGTEIEARVRMLRDGVFRTYSGTRTGTTESSKTVNVPHSSYYGQYIMFAMCTPAPPLGLLDELMQNMFAFLRPA